jgi:hypothetical protein
MRHYLALVAAITMGVPALAANTPVFENNSALTGDGHCIYNSRCASVLDNGGDFAAQKFSLSQAKTLTGAGVANYVMPGSSSISSFNWMIFKAGDTGGLPGTLVSSGNFAALTSATVLGSSKDGYYDLSLAKFALPSVFLDAGDYYFALQATTTDIRVYLSSGFGDTGAVQTKDHGDNWTTGYQTYSSIAVSLYEAESISAVPEPVTWTLMIAGFGLVGTAMRRRTTGLGAAL